MGSSAKQNNAFCFFSRKRRISINYSADLEAAEDTIDPNLNEAKRRTKSYAKQKRFLLLFLKENDINQLS
jgi:hypothetical protein